MVKSLWLFNVLLALLSSGLLAGLVNSLEDHRALSGAPRAMATVQQPRAEIPEGQNQPSTAGARQRPLSEFDLILQRDPFEKPADERPEPPKPPVNPIVRKPPPPPAQLPILLGTIMVGEERKAVLEEGKRQEIYRIGQAVGGGILTKIEADRVEITRGQDRAEVLMKSAIKQSRPDADHAGQGRPPASRFSRGAPPAARQEPDQAAEEAQRATQEAPTPVVGETATASLSGVTRLARP